MNLAILNIRQRMTNIRLKSKNRLRNIIKGLLFMSIYLEMYNLKKKKKKARIKYVSSQGVMGS